MNSTSSLQIQNDVYGSSVGDGWRSTATATEVTFRDRTPPIATAIFSLYKDAAPSELEFPGESLKNRRNGSANAVQSAILNSSANGPVRLAALRDENWDSPPPSHWGINE